MDRRIGDSAPDFSAQTTQGEVPLSPWQEEKWVVLFSHPADPRKDRWERKE